MDLAWSLSMILPICGKGVGARLDVDGEPGDNIGRRLAPGEQKSAYCGDTDEPGTDATEPVKSL